MELSHHGYFGKHGFQTRKHVALNKQKTPSGASGSLCVTMSAKLFIARFGREKEKK